ncbi:tRNA uridine 5-carboxymethylaminomethyl modifica tion enzyme MnmG [Novosphingobium sp. PY1]|nr:tRNA uridine 5-carboxymethylaminomethyl modifica tion enzyme MnmG [Novosphingobium sp. PY1]
MCAFHVDLPSAICRESTGTAQAGPPIALSTREIQREIAPEPLRLGQLASGTEPCLGDNPMSAVLVPARKGNPKCPCSSRPIALHAETGLTWMEQNKNKGRKEHW